jgi:hypothetical protein
MNKDELSNAFSIRAQREAHLNAHLKAVSGHETRDAEKQRQVLAAQAASRARFAAYQEIEAERAAAIQARQAERDAQRAQVQVNRDTPVESSSIPRLAQIRTAQRAAVVEAEKQQRLAARQGMSDFVLHHLPRNDPKMIAYREMTINPPVVEGA